MLASVILNSIYSYTHPQKKFVFFWGVIFSFLVVTSCNEIETGTSEMNYVDPVEYELRRTTLSPGDSLVFKLQFLAEPHKIENIEISLDRRKPEPGGHGEILENIFFDSHYPNSNEVLITTSWLIPSDIIPTNEGSYYLVTIRHKTKHLGGGNNFGIFIQE